jgi:CHAT domain-containing protein
MGGELVGLARALLTAGASRCVVALWPVDDFPACVLMHEFHRHLASGEVSPSLALSMAQSAIRLMSQTDLAKAYRSLGGAEASANRSLRRGGASLNSCQRTERLLKLDPEFAEKSAPEKSVTLDGSLPRIWGSFVMVGC